MDYVIILDDKIIPINIEVVNASEATLNPLIEDPEKIVHKSVGSTEKFEFENSDLLPLTNNSLERLTLCSLEAAKLEESLQVIQPQVAAAKLQECLQVIQPQVAILNASNSLTSSTSAPVLSEVKLNLKRKSRADKIFKDKRDFVSNSHIKERSSVPLEECCICGDTGHSAKSCSYVPLTSHIADKAVPTRARASLPDSLELKKLADNTDSVYVKQFISAGTEFGPFHAEKQSTLNPLIHFPIKIFSEDKILYYLDTVDEDKCNWMIFVNPANYVEEQNLICYQKNLDIYFATVKDINPGESLKIWYAPFYALKMGKELLGFESLAKQQKQETELLNELVKKHQNVVPRSTWNCKFCYRLENSISSFASHLLEHYQHMRQKRCETCNKKFKDNTKYLNHLRYSQCSKNKDISKQSTFCINQIEKPKKDKFTKMDNPVYTCYVCDKIFSKKTVLVGHLAKCHGLIMIENKKNKEFKNDSIGGPLLQFDPGPEILDQPNLILEKSNLSTNILDIGENYNVGNENLTLSVDLMLNQNADCNVTSKLTTPQDTEELHTCDICLKKFRTFRAISEHLVAHTGRYFCNDCKKVFTRKESLSSHRCHRQYVLKCKTCGLIFYQAKYLKQHIELRHKNKFRCKKCLKCFITHRKLEEHNCSEIPTENKIKFTCAHCAKYFFTEKYLRRHMKTHIKDTNSKDLTSCPICGQIFVSQEAYRRHLRLQHKEASFDCDICYKKFTRRDTVIEHLMELHGIGSERSQCDICFKFYSSKKKLTKHVKKVHNKSDSKHLKLQNKILNRKIDNGLICPICKKKIKLKSSLRRHIKDIHSLDITVKTNKSKPNDSTPKRFYTRPENEFIKKDEGYACPFCPTVTKLRNSLRRHIRNKHPQQKLVNSKETIGQANDTTDKINAELDEMIADDLFKDLKESIDDLDFTTEVAHTMDNLIESSEIIDALLKEKTANLDTSAFNLSDDISIIPVNCKKFTQKDVFLSMPDL